mmetsp:Transcript_30363/g.57410  ORF Transcript_30363/g.57410 Transcript_30363/m.57410 type:complete len:202 (-) Transcript_30363:341-946(-)
MFLPLVAIILLHRMFPTAHDMPRHHLVLPPPILAPLRAMSVYRRIQPTRRPHGTDLHPFILRIYYRGPALPILIHDSRQQRLFIGTVHLVRTRDVILMGIAPRRRLHVGPSRPPRRAIIPHGSIRRRDHLKERVEVFLRGATTATTRGDALFRFLRRVVILTSVLLLPFDLLFLSPSLLGLPIGQWRNLLLPHLLEAVGYR